MEARLRDDIVNNAKKCLEFGFLDKKSEKKVKRLLDTKLEDTTLVAINETIIKSLEGEKRTSIGFERDVDSSCEGGACPTR